MKQEALLLILILLGLNGCANNSSVPINDFCQIAKPIRDHKDDTAKTRDQVREHNAKYLCVCNDDCPL